MRYDQDKILIDYFVKFFRKVFSQNTSWLNEENEVVELKEGNTPQIYDHLPREPEDYPFLAIEGGGESGDIWGINDKVDNVWVSEKFGESPKSYAVLGNGYSQAFGIILSEDLKLRDIGFALRYAGRLNEDIDVYLSLASGTVPGITISSGTINAFEDKDFVWKWCEFNPQTVLQKNQLYYVVCETDVNCMYYIARDPNPDLTITPYPYYAYKYGSGAWNVSSASTLFAVVQGPVYIRLGGGIKGNLSFRVEAKDIHTMRSVENIVFIYLNALKHADLKRHEAITYPPSLNMDFDMASDTTELGIKIINISKSAENIRERGNDRIFSIIINIEIYSFWEENFEKDTIQKIVPTTQSFDP